MVESGAERALGAASASELRHHVGAIMHALILGVQIDGHHIVAKMRLI